MASEPAYPWETAGTREIPEWERVFLQRMEDIVIPLPPGLGIVTAAPASFVPDPAPIHERLAEWARMVEAARRPPRHCVILGQAKWNRMMDVADEADRATLTQLREEGSIIVSPFLPAADEAYLFTPEPADLLPRPGRW